MSQASDTRRFVVGKVSLALPASLAKRQDAPIDSATSVFEGNGLTVIVDQGPFADGLDSHAGRPGYRSELRSIAGVPGRLVSYRSPERGTYTVAARLPAPTLVTVVVEADLSVPEHVPKGIIESLQLLP